MRRRRSGHGDDRRARQLAPLHTGVLRDVLTLVVGLFSGILSGAFGVGGAVITTPGIRVLGASAFVAVGTTLPAILPSAASGTIRYAQEGLVDWNVAAWTAPFGVAAAVGGSLLSHVVPGNGHWLMILTALLLGLTAYRMARQPGMRSDPDVEQPDGPGTPRRTREHRTPARLIGVGLAAGGLSGLLGVGGGIVMVPGFTQVVKLPLKIAIATSLLCVGVFAVPGTITHAALGDIDWRFALLLAVGVIPGARLGASLAIRAGDRRLRIFVALFLSVVAVIYGAGEVIALAR